jgi:hypothetical protein
LSLYLIENIQEGMRNATLTALIMFSENNIIEKL